MAVDLSVRKIRSFVYVAELKSFRRAAEKLNISSSALSTHIRELEEAFGLPLLRRTTRQVALTAHGERLFERSRQIIGEFDAMVGELRGTATKADHLRIGCIPTMAETLLPDAIAELVRDHPKCSVEILDTGSREILRRFEEGDIIHFAIIPKPERLTGLIATPLLEERVVAIVAKGHPLANRQELPFATLAGYPNITLHSSISVGLTMDKIARESGIKLEPTFATLRHTTLARLVQAGLGIGVLPAMSLQIAKWPQLVAVPLSDPVVSRKIVVVQRKREVLTPVGRRLLAIVQSLARDAPDLAGVTASLG